MGNHDLLALPNASEQVREEVARVAGVVLGEVAWRGVATWRGLASPPKKSLQHGTIVNANPIREWAG
jgi:hypothetical protein